MYRLHWNFAYNISNFWFYCCFNASISTNYYLSSFVLSLKPGRLSFVVIQIGPILSLRVSNSQRSHDGTYGHHRNNSSIVIQNSKTNLEELLETNSDTYPKKWHFIIRYSRKKQNKILILFILISVESKFFNFNFHSYSGTKYHFTRDMILQDKPRYRDGVGYNLKDRTNSSGPHPYGLNFIYSCGFDLSKKVLVCDM